MKKGGILMTKVLERIEEMRTNMVEALMGFVSINSVNPAFGGPGEKEKADWLEGLLRDLGYPEVERVDVVDERGVVRSNILAKIAGKHTERTLWVVTHIDTVPEGDITLWRHDPFTPFVEDGKVFGRGAEDNGGSMVASIFAGKALMDLGLSPWFNYGLALVADEEAGSKYGISYLIKEGYFSKDDLFLVPDAGNSKGDFVEIAEKSILWFKVEILGRQGHASKPSKTINAFRAGIKAISLLDETLHKKFNSRNDLFDEPFSTFEPTKCEKTVDNVNTIPGRFVFYFDCRLIPEHDPDDVLRTVEEVLSSGYEYKLEVLNKQKAPAPTSRDSYVVRKLEEILRSQRNLEVKVGGIGGGTCAAFFRREGWEAVVWSTIDETAHQPNEYKRIDHMVEDAKVFAQLALGG